MYESVVTFGITLLVVCFSSELVAQQEIHTTMDPASVEVTIKKVADIVNREYFDAKVAEQVSDALLSNLKQGHYSRIDSREKLAASVNKLLLETTDDKHLALSISPQEALRDSSAEKLEVESRELEGKRTNFGLQKLEILPGNIGYLNITSFFRENEAGESIVAAMAFLSNSDAIIVDMRHNLGGSPGTVALLCSYFFEGSRRKLFDIVPRSGTAQTYWTDSSVKNRNSSRPLYVLTDTTTFSAGEGFAFLLQEQKRALVVGKKTAGAANPGRAYQVDTFFEITVPSGKILTAMRGENWEGVGVSPDVDCNSQDALHVAHRIALQELIKKSQDQFYRNKLKEISD